MAFKLSIAVTIQFIGFILANTGPLALSSAVPFHLISPAEFNALSKLSNGNPFITQQRLLSSGSKNVKDILKSIFTGLVRFVYIVGLDSEIDSALNKPSTTPTQGYPFCSIQANGNNKHTIFQRSLDPPDDATINNFGTIPLNFFYDGLAKIEKIDEGTKTEELRHLFKSFKPSFHDLFKPSNQQQQSNSPSSDANKEKIDNGPPPVFNCIVILKEPSQPTTTPPPPTSTTPSPSYPHHHQPNSYPYPQHQPNLYPQGGNSLNPYQVLALPYPPYFGLVGSGPGAPYLPNWSDSQYYPQNTPNADELPKWPYWSMANPNVVAQ